MSKKKDIKYVQLEPGAFLSDTDYQIMTAEQRGIYCSIIFYLYANGGNLKLNSDTDLLQQKGNSVIAMLSNCYKTGKEFELLWNAIEKKFVIKNGVLSHKRVTEELKRACNYRKKKSLAGKKGMQHRYNRTPNSVIPDVITKESKVKESKYNPPNPPINKTKLFPIKGKTCCKKGCKLPAIYTDTSGSYDHHYCGPHMPDEVKELYTW